MIPYNFEAVLAELAEGREGGVPVKYDEEIFAGTDYPRNWEDFVGQDVAKRQLQVNLASAAVRDTRIEHTLLASGVPGVGKTTLATMLAWHAGVGLVQATGPLAQSEAIRLVKGMRNHDILFIDEAHLLVQGNRNRADWLLPFLLEGCFYTERGAVKVPDVAVVAATTDVGKLPATLMGRFMCQPRIVAYSPEEATQIAVANARRMGVDLPAYYFSHIAMAANHNPRVMRRILTTLRDLQLAHPGSDPDLALALEWSGVSWDGLDTMAQEVLLALLAAPKFTASVESLQAQLNEPGPLRHAEQLLLQRGLVTVTGRGRQLTDAGRARAVELAREYRNKKTHDNA